MALISPRPDASPERTDSRDRALFPAAVRFGVLLCYACAAQKIRTIVRNVVTNEALSHLCVDLSMRCV